MTAARPLRNDPRVVALRDEAPEGVRAEVLHGVVMMSPAPRSRHQVAQNALQAQLSAALSPRRRQPDDPPTRWRIIPVPELHLGSMPDILNPDIAGWRSERAPRLDDDPIDVAPDWVCEVLSPSTEVYDRTTKMDAYGAHGVGHVWLVDPEAKRLEVYSRSHGRLVEVARFDGESARAAPFEEVEVDLAWLWQ